MPRPLSAIIVPSLFFLFFSCADGASGALSATGTVVFDFKDAESAPVQRLAVFVQLDGDVRRCGGLTVSNAGSGLSWAVSKPEIFTGQNRGYACSLNLGAPYDEPIPDGKYAVMYTDASGDEDIVDFSVAYDKALLSSTSGTCRDFVPEASENVAIYDGAGVLLFMGRPRASWGTSEDVLRDYKLAQTKRVCYLGSENTVICLMPPESLRDD